MLQFFHIRLCEPFHVRGGFGLAHLAGVPAPRETRPRRPAVRAEERTERAELEPAHVQFAGELGCRKEAADVRAPVRNAAKAGIDPYCDLVPQSRPGRVQIAGPQPSAHTLHAREAGTMQHVRTHVWTIAQ